MKLVIITLVDAYKEAIYELFKAANIHDYSVSDIAGFKWEGGTNLSANWFAGKPLAADSELFFFFAEPQNIETLFKSIRAFNATLESKNPIRAVVVPVEQYV
ncbi:MAG: hypothetical protein GYB39_10615 [Algicola sp.]|nr:hypothetical protein [Algicola sp.]